MQIFLGTLPKRLLARPDWLLCPEVAEIASASECMSPGPPDRISRWTHNALGLYDTPEAGCALVPAEEAGSWTLLAFQAPPLIFQRGEERPWNPWRDSAAPEMDLREQEHLGYDVVGLSEAGFFECSPLSCNGLAREVAVNRWCLVDDREQALRLARWFSTDESRVEPAWAYLVVAVSRWLAWPCPRRTLAP